MSANFFVIWGDPTKPWTCEIDPSSFVTLAGAEAHVNSLRKTDERPASIFEFLEGNDGKHWRRA